MQEMNSRFHSITLADREWMNPLISSENGLATDNCFGTYYLWGDTFGLKVADCGDRLLACCGSGEALCFFYPHGTGSLEQAVEAMAQKAAEQETMLVVNGVTESQKEELEQTFPGRFSFVEKRSRADYIYEAESLAVLSGKKLHSKKNHCNRFEREWPDWHCEVLEKTHIPECMELFKMWEDSHQEGADEMQEAEQTAVRRAFRDYEALRMEGIALYAGGKLAAFSFGELVGENGFDVHFEKADTRIHGAFNMVNRELVRMLRLRYPGLLYVNREEDMGLENLRKAKESYRPKFLIHKYSASAAV